MQATEKNHPRLSLLVTGALVFLIAFQPGCSSSPEERSSLVNEKLDEVLARLRDVSAEDEEREKDRRELERLLLIDPGNPEVLFACAVFAAEVGDRSRAAAHLDALLRRDPTHVEAGALRAELALQAGNAPLAARLLENHIRLSPSHPTLRELRASVHHFEGDHAACLAELSAAERLGAPRWRIAYHRGLVAEELGETRQARALFDECLELNPSFHRARDRRRALELEEEVEKNGNP